MIQSLIRMAKKKRSNFFVRLAVILAILLGIVTGAYFLLDKLIVPKYFGSYNINTLGDLVSMVSTLYNTPKEKDLVKNGFTLSDKANAEQKLKDAGFPKFEDTSLDYDKIASGDFSISASEELVMTDRELASILNEMVAHGVLTSKVPSLKFVNQMDLTILELNIKPKTDNSALGYDKKSASVNVIFKFDTATIIDQISQEMDTPVFLLNMIIPKTMYVTLSYDLNINESGECLALNGNMSINGRTVKQSKILLDLMVSFIFPESENMTVDKLTDTMGETLIKGVDLLGNVEFRKNVKNGQNGVALTFAE